jgi:CubicO group peptidase (beta-lactamase class C family)/beta-glucosidase-like glycosyl hydrolase
MIKKTLSLCTLLFCFVSAFAQLSREAWVDSVFNSLNTNRRIGQLFMIQVPAQGDAAAMSEVRLKIRNEQVGGLILSGGNPLQLANLVRGFQEQTDIPLFVSQDAEGGLGMSIDSTITYPSPLVLGAIRNDSLLYELGRAIAQQLKMVGVNLSFAPTVELNASSTLRYQSFGENKYRITNKAIAFMKGMTDEQVLTCVKNFPVQSITITDVQKDWPIIQPTVDTAQVYTFRKLFENRLTGFIPSSTELPLFYTNMNLARKNNFTSQMLSSLFIGNWVKKNMNYQGLAFADLRNVPPIQEKNSEGLASLYALQAGNDIILYPRDLNIAIRKIRRQVRRDKALEEQLNNSVKKILAAKYDAGLWKKNFIDTDNLLLKLNSPQAQLLSRKLQQAAITVLKNSDNVLPVSVLDNKQFVYISSDTTQKPDELYHYLSRYVHAERYALHQQSALATLAASKQPLTCVIGIYPQTTPEKLAELKKLLELFRKHHVILCDFGNEEFLRTAAQYPTVITAYTNTLEMLEAMPQVIFGGLTADALLPMKVSDQLQTGTGNIVPAIDRLVYSTPEDAGMDSRLLSKIDSIAKEAIRNMATPGCQVLVARNGKVVYDKSFGYLTYEKKTPVTENTIYDLASLTKVSATLQATMFMYEKGLIDLNKKASFYLPELRNSNKKDITIIDMLTHQAGLAPFIPLWPQTMKDTTFLPQFYSRRRDAVHPFPVAPGLYGSQAMKDSVWSWIIQSKMADKIPRTPYTYRYSDLGLMIMQHIAERVLNQPLDDFLQQNFYEPLGAYTTRFNPTENQLSVQAIAPTEFDKIYRKKLIAGTVHDERAAMMGGVSGHAGLFSSALDLAKLGQMLLQEGKYGGYQYYKPETVRTFATKMYKGRRAIGWDRPVQSEWNSPTSLTASPLTYGHTGFTGTCMWIDPEFNLVYIFLSNRVYPDRNTRLISSNIRSRIQEVVYQSIFNYCLHSQ